MKKILKDIICQIDTLRQVQKKSANMADFIYIWRT